MIVYNYRQQSIKYRLPSIKRVATFGVEEHELNRTILQQAAAHIMYYLFYAIHQYGYGPFLGLIDSQTITPTFLIFPFGQF